MLPHRRTWIWQEARNSKRPVHVGEAFDVYGRRRSTLLLFRLQLPCALFFSFLSSHPYFLRRNRNENMGLTFSSIFGRLLNWRKEQDVRILMLGLDSAGKVCFGSNMSLAAFANHGLQRQRFCTGCRRVPKLCWNPPRQVEAD